MTAAFNQPVICPILVGRTPDLAALYLLMEQTKSGQGQMALLCGEAGIGKSRLVAELKTEAIAQGFQFLQGQCFPTDHSCPYAPLLDLFRSIFLHTPAAQFATDLASFARELTPLLPEALHLFPELAMLPPLPSLEPEQEKRRLFAALARFFLTQAATRPLLLIVEDVHWSDESSLEFLHYLARHCAAQPLLVVLTYRSDELGLGLGHWLAELDREHLAREVLLSRLTRSETDAMLRAIFDLPQAWHSETLNALYELTEGNPFFIEEMLKSLMAVGEIVCSNGSWECKPLGTWHIPRSIQVAVKLRADQVSASARQVLQLAAVAGRRFDFAVLQQVTHHDEPQLLTLMYETLGAFEQARSDYEQALGAAHEAHDGVAEWQSLIDLGFLWAERDYEQTGAYFRRAIELARTLADSKLLAHSLNRLGNWHVNAEQPLEALRYHQEALTIFQEVHDLHGLAETLDLLGLTHYMGGDLLQSHTYYDQAIAVFRETDHRPGLVSSLTFLMLCSNNYTAETLVPVMTSLDEVVSQGETALSLAREIGQRSAEALTLFCWGLCLGTQGNYAQAIASAEESLAIAEEIEHRQWMTAAHWTLAALYLDLLELERARRHLEQALRLSQELGSLFWMCNTRASLALLYLWSHDLAQAELCLNTALDPDVAAHTRTQRFIWSVRAELALAQRKPEQALTIIEQLLITAVNRVDEGSIPYLSHMRGKALLMLKQFAEAEVALQAAQAGATALAPL